MQVAPIRIADARTVLVRAGVLLAFVAAASLLPLAAGPSRALAAVLPLFVVLLFVELLPVLWPRAVDLCAPPVLANLVGAFLTASTMIYFIDAGELRIDLVDAYTPERAEELTRLALYASIVGQLSYYLGYYTRFGTSLWVLFPRVEGIVWNRRRLAVVSIAAGLAFAVVYAIFQARTGVPLFDL